VSSPDDALADLRHSLGKLEDYPAGDVPRPDLDREIEGAVDAFVRLAHYAEKGLFPDEWDPTMKDR